MLLPHVPIVEHDVVLTPELIQKYSSGISKIDSLPFEGVVINHGGYVKKIKIENEGFSGEVEKEFPAGSFKIINKHYDARK
jgi:hypothetical protein